MTRIEFPFKGGRTYVHSTSILDALHKVLPSVSSLCVDVLFKRKIQVPCCLFEIRHPRADDHVLVKYPGSECNYSESCICINPSPGFIYAETQRVPYEEDGIAAAAVVADDAIFSNVVVGFSDSEIMVSLCKRLHLERVDDKRKWMFARYVGRFPLNLKGDLMLRISKKLGGRMTCTEVYSSGDFVGSIYFV